MSIKKWIAKILPRFILLRLQLRREQSRLGSLPAEECNAKNLANLSQSQLEDFFVSERIDQSWQSVSTELDKFRIPDMTGGVNPGDRRALFYVMTALGTSSVLEVGTHIGASTIHVAAAIGCNTKSSGKAPGLTSVDIANVNDPQIRPWISHGAKKSPRAMVDSLGYGDFVQFKTCSSLEYLKKCVQKFDLIFLDGDHSASTTYQEIPAALNLLNPGGSILLHDYFPNLKPLWSNGSLIHGPFLAAKRLTSEGNRFRILPLGELPWPTKLGSNRTSLALVTGIQ